MSYSIGLDLFGRGFPTEDPRWMSFSEALTEIGLVVMDGRHETSDFYLAVDFSELPAWAREIPKERRGLLAVEPPVVNPRQYQPRVRDLFGQRFALSPQHAGFLRGQWHPSPSYWDPSLPEISGAEPSHRVGILNANKNSFVSGSLYGLRRDVIRACAENGIDLVLAGHNWDAGVLDTLRRDLRKFGSALKSRAHVNIRNFDPIPLPLNKLVHLGPVAEKKGFFSKVQLVVTIENSRTYVSEKLVEVIRNRRVPIYVGPDLRAFGIPDSVIAHSEPDARSITEVIKRMSDDDVERIIEAGQHWVSKRDSIYTKSQQEGMLSLAEVILGNINRM